MSKLQIAEDGMVHLESKPIPGPTVSVPDGLPPDMGKKDEPKITVVEVPEIRPDHPFAIRTVEGEPFSAFAVLDEKDWKRWSRYHWHATQQGFIYRWIKDATAEGGRRPVWLHRVIHPCGKNRFVKFIDNDERNLRRKNMRI